MTLSFVHMGVCSAKMYIMRSKSLSKKSISDGSILLSREASRMVHIIKSFLSENRE